MTNEVKLSEDEVREKFEEHMRGLGRGSLLKKSKDFEGRSQYFSESMQNKWEGWLASYYLFVEGKNVEVDTTGGGYLLY